MGVLKTTVHCWIVGSTICVQCSSLKPVLTEENKVARLLMALPFRDPVDLTKYHDMLDQIHLDEKWFFLTQKKERYLLLPEEKKPKCCIKHKSHITKVMFLCAVVYPRFNPSANSWWDGKLGIWPRELVKQKSKNRRYLLLPEEKKPKCCIKHKSHITKVMFLCAVVCPRFNPSANSWWDGKLGIWPRKLVKQKSKNRPRGTLVWKNKV